MCYNRATWGKDPYISLDKSPIKGEKKRGEDYDKQAITKTSARIAKDLTSWAK